MKGVKKFIIIFSPILIVVLFVIYYFFYKTINVNSSDQTCKVDEDCIMAMTECSCDCGIPINIIHWKKYLDEQEKKCKFYTGIMCGGMHCEQELKCINNICTDVSK